MKTQLKRTLNVLILVTRISWALFVFVADIGRQIVGLIFKAMVIGLVVGAITKKERK